MTLERERNRLEDVVIEGVRGRLVGTHTAIAGVVEKVYSDRQAVDVRVVVKRVYQDLEGVEVVEDWPLLSEVPVWAPHAGGYHISLPISVGDECLVLFLERDLSRWFSDSSEQESETRRMHDASDGVALVGLNSKPNRITPPDADVLEISTDDATTSLRLLPGGEIELSAPTKITFDTPLADFLGAVQASGTMTAADFVSGLITLLTHKQSLVTPGVGTSGTPVP